MEWSRILESGDLATIEYPGFGSPKVIIKKEETKLIGPKREITEGSKKISEKSKENAPEKKNLEKKGIPSAKATSSKKTKTKKTHRVHKKQKKQKKTSKKQKPKHKSKAKSKPKKK